MVWVGRRKVSLGAVGVVGDLAVVRGCAGTVVDKLGLAMEVIHTLPTETMTDDARNPTCPCIGERARNRCI